MGAELEEKTERYERLLAGALDVATVAAPADTPLSDAARDHLEMARAYLEDGRHFHREGDLVNALASFSYGHGWLDAGARAGLLAVPRDDHRFTI